MEEVTTAESLGSSIVLEEADCAVIGEFVGRTFIIDFFFVFHFLYYLFFIFHFTFLVSDFLSHLLEELDGIEYVDQLVLLLPYFCSIQTIHSVHAHPVTVFLDVFHELRGGILVGFVHFHVHFSFI